MVTLASALVCLVLLTRAHQPSQAANMVNYNGDYKLESSENFDEYMKAVGKILRRQVFLVNGWFNSFDTVIADIALLMIDTGGANRTSQF